ncbi:MAG: Hsp20/alpha crystallin family protein [Rhodothermales bacterium]
MTSLIRFSPTANRRRMQREIDRLFESFFPMHSLNQDESAVWTPRVDLSETDDAYFIHLDLPGLNKENVEINFHDGTLSISGERRTEESEEGCTFVRVERSYGSFYRAFTLPQTVDGTNIEAAFENGVLDIRVPKAEESKPRRIEIS